MSTPPNLLLDSPAVILQKLLTSYSGALFQAPVVNAVWPLYISELPDTDGVPDNAGCVCDTEGVVLARLSASGQVIQDFGLQIKVRGRTYSQAFTLLAQTATWLSKVHIYPIAVAQNSYTIDTVQQSSPVLSLGQDEKRRALFSLNVKMTLIFGL